MSYENNFSPQSELQESLLEMVLLGRDFISGTTTDSNGHTIEESDPLSGWYVLQCFTGSKEPSTEAENTAPYSDTMLITGRSFVLHQPLGASKLQPKNRSCT